MRRTLCLRKEFDNFFKYSGDVAADEDYHINNNPIIGSLTTNKDKLLNKIKFIIGFYNNPVIAEIVSKYFDE